MDLGRGESAGDASFSYLREESLIQKNRNKMKSDQEGEISVFGAERYFNLRIEDDNISNDPKIVERRSSSSSTKKENHLDHDLGNERPRLAPGTPSACSEVSWNSRSTAMLLRNPSRHHNGSHNNKNKKKKMKKKINSYGRSILATLGCAGSCLDEKAVYVVDDHDRHHHGKLVLENIREHKSADHDNVHHGHHLELERSSKRSEEQFAFPILSSTNTTTTTIAKDYNKRVDQQEVEEEDGRVSLEVFGSKTKTSKGNDTHDDVAANLERKLSVLTWDAIPVKPGHNIINKQISSMYNDQDNNTLDSDASSDLFEIENITASSRSPEQPPPPPPPQQQQHPASVLLLKASRQLLVSNDNISRHTTLNYCHNNAASSQYYSSYEPSEASIEWSVVTASAAADQMSSALSDYNEKKLAAAANSRMTAGGGSVSCYNNKVMARSRSSSFKAGRVDNEEVRSRGGHSHGFLGCKSHKAVRVAETAQRNVSSHKDQIIKANQTVDIIRPQLC